MSYVLVLSRGHGFGHAARDLRVVDSIRRQRPDLKILLAASGTAAEYFRMHDVPCVDLGIDDAEDMTPTAFARVQAFLRRIRRPQLVVTDEVVAALPYCRKVWKVPCVLLTDWFYAEFGEPGTDPFLDSATEILMLDFRAAHPGPYAITAPIRYVGPVVRPFADRRARVREELGVPDGSLLAVNTLGGMTGRDEAGRMTELALRAWNTKARPGDQLHILAPSPSPSPPPSGESPTAEAPRAGGGSVVWRGIVPEPESLFAAADVVIADAMGTTVCDLVYNRIPVLGLVDRSAGFPASFHLRVDEMAANGLMVCADVSCTPEALWTSLQRAIAHTGPAIAQSSLDRFEWATGAVVADLVLRHLPSEESSPGSGERSSAARPGS
ncbi:glycosyl transferase [Streptomyces sp. NPDC054770]